MRARMKVKMKIQMNIVDYSRIQRMKKLWKQPTTPHQRPLDRLQPKKRWLREACMEQQQLAKPLRWDFNTANSCHFISENSHASTQWCLSESQLPSLHVNFNQNEDEPIQVHVEYAERFTDPQHSSLEFNVQDRRINRTLMAYETRPTVLMLARRSQSPQPCMNETSQSDPKFIVERREENFSNLPLPEDNQKWLGALELMELAKAQEKAALALKLSKNMEVPQCPDYTYL